MTTTIQKPICLECGNEKTKYFILFINAVQWSCSICSMKSKENN